MHNYTMIASAELGKNCGTVVYVMHDCYNKVQYGRVSGRLLHNLA